MRSLPLFCLLAFIGAAQAAPSPKMGVVIVKSDTVDAAVSIDGEPIGVVPIPGPWTVPAGQHTVKVGESEQSVTVTAGGRHTVTFKTAAPKQEKAAPARLTRVVKTGPGFSLAKTGYVLGGVGVLAVGLGVYFGLDANALADDAKGLDPMTATRAEQQGLIDDSERSALLANISLGLGGAAILGGAALALLSSDGLLNQQPVLITPTAGGLSLGGQF